MFTNPVIKRDFPDPFILKVGDTFYAYATNSLGLNIQTATSKDLVNWRLGNDALPKLPDWAKFTTGLTWAPEVMEINGKYVMYYTTRDKASDRQCVGAAVSDTPEGPFTDTRPGPLVCQAELGGTIDASPYREGDKLYLFYKNDGNCCGKPTSLFIQEMASDGLNLTGQPTKLISNDVDWEGAVVEAPTMWKHDGKYYLFFSGSDYSNEKYAVGYATCDSLTGPCTQAPENPIIRSRTEAPKVIGPGHQTLVQLGDQTWIVYHAWEISSVTGRQTARRQVWIDKLDWVDGKPVVRGPTTGEQPVPVIK